jgi:hypothetical protein
VNLWETIISVRGPILTILVTVSKIMEEKDIPFNIFVSYNLEHDLLFSLVVRVLGYRFGGLGSIPGTTKKK